MSDLRAQDTKHGKIKLWIMTSDSTAKYKGQEQTEFKVHDDQVSDLETQRELATAEWRNVFEDHKPHKADSHHSLLFPAEENNFVYLLCK